MFLEKILYEFLKQFDGLDLKSITIQTDNGTEFTNKYRKTYGKKPYDYINKRYKYTLNTEYLEDEIKTISGSLIEIADELENIILEENNKDTILF